jgi:hypothetical protein
MNEYTDGFTLWPDFFLENINVPPNTILLVLLTHLQTCMFPIAATAILAMLWSGSVIVYVAMSFSLFLSSCASVQRFKLSRQESTFLIQCTVSY